MTDHRDTAAGLVGSLHALASTGRVLPLDERNAAGVLAQVAAVHALIAIADRLAELVAHTNPDQ